MTSVTSARNLLRAAIVAAAALELWHFSDSYRKAFVTLTGGNAQWLLNGWEAFAVGVAAPLGALAAAGLAIANRRLGIAIYCWARRCCCIGRRSSRLQSPSRSTEFEQA